MEDIWKGTIPLFIEVLVCLDNLFPHTGKEKDPSEIYLDFLPDSHTQRTLLLERWKLKLNDKRFVYEQTCSVSILKAPDFCERWGKFLGCY